MSVAALVNAAPNGRSSVACDLAQIFRRYGDDYARTHRLTLSQRKVMYAIVNCRTAALGGHRDWCDRCGFERYFYHSCRNRHCPQCQSTATAAWVEARRKELLPVPYFHQVFTLPHELNPLILWTEANQRRLLKLLFDAAAQTLLTFGQQEFGGTIGITFVLHTWDQQLRPHYHVHAIVPSGALSPDRSRWIAGGGQYLFHVRALSKVFRAKYLCGVEQLLRQGRLDLPPQLVALSLGNGRRQFLRPLKKKPWAVYSKPPFAGPRKLIDYLSRYTHRVAISNHRLLGFQDGQVTFTYRDRQDDNRRKTAMITADEFIGRFLKHVLPDRFVRIRHYGLLANRGKRDRLNQCRQLLGCREPLEHDETPKNADEWAQQLLGIDLTLCPCCGGTLHRELIEPALPRRNHDPTKVSSLPHPVARPP